MIDAPPFLQYGAGGHGRVVFDAVRSTGLQLDLVADDDPQLAEFEGLKVLHPPPALGATLPAAYDFIVAVGDNGARKGIFDRLLDSGGRARTVIHRSAVISPSAEIAVGTLVCAGAVVNPGVTIGVNCILNTACSVDHDCLIGDHVHLCPGVRLGGAVRVGSGAMLGLGAVVLPGVSIGGWSVVGAGAVVLRDLPDGVVAFGNPARVRPSLH